MPNSMTNMRDVLRLAPVIPILTIKDPGRAVDLAKALVAGGLPVIEVLMRTPGAATAIEGIARGCPEAVVGAGTLRDPDSVSRAVATGAAFGISPGLTPALAAAAAEASLPLLPGVASASDVMAAMDFGYREMKYFPAYGPAGVSALKMMAPVFPEVSFCPTGGITLPDLKAYLSLPNCMVVGSSWVAPAHLIEAGDWKAITRLAAEALRTAGEIR